MMGCRSVRVVGGPGAASACAMCRCAVRSRPVALGAGAWLGLWVLMCWGATATIFFAPSSARASPTPSLARFRFRAARQPTEASNARNGPDRSMHAGRAQGWGARWPGWEIQQGAVRVFPSFAFIRQKKKAREEAALQKGRLMGRRACRLRKQTQTTHVFDLVWTTFSRLLVNSLIEINLFFQLIDA